MKFNHKHYMNYQAGFSLVEIMIGLVIGLLVTLVISQVMSVFEGQKRSTTGMADAQTNGAIALYNIGRELQFAGYPIMPTGLAGVADSPLECTVFTYGTTGITSISPVTITDGVAATGVNASDTITMRYGDSQSGGVPAIIKANPVGQVVSVDNNFGCKVNDISLVSDGINCDLSTVTAVTGTAIPMSVTLQNTNGATVGTNLSCLGAWNTVIYAVNQTTGNLERSVNGAAAVPVVAGVVNIQAQYGVSNTVSSNQVNQWVDANGAWAEPLSVASRNRIKSVRVAIVARNPKIEPAAVTSACSSISAATPSGLCTWAGISVAGAITTASPAPTLDLSPGDTNWARYHYRVFETVMPLRNIVWSRATL